MLSGRKIYSFNLPTWPLKKVVRPLGKTRDFHKLNQVVPLIETAELINQVNHMTVLIQQSDIKS